MAAPSPREPLEDPLKFIKSLLTVMSVKGGSDLFLTVGYPPQMKVNGLIQPVTSRRLSAEDAARIVLGMMSEKHRREFERDHEANFALSLAAEKLGRYRVNAMLQQGHPGAVLRTIPTRIPTVEALGVPPILKDLVLAERGLIIMVGATGSGKSTTLAAMVNHRNRSTRGHILTIEDPIEFVHDQVEGGCVVNQREVGVDTPSWESALTNSLRQAPDVIQIGEIRTRETMEFAVQFSETGHLCLSTLHANNANQALDRIINLFPEEKRNQVLLDLSLNLKAVVSQRLVRTADGQGRAPAVEVMINTPYIQELIQRGDVGEIKAAMRKGAAGGMQTFDGSLLELYRQGLIDEAEALRNADSQNELRMLIKQHRQARGAEPALTDAGLEHLCIEGDEKDTPLGEGAALEANQST